MKWTSTFKFLPIDYSISLARIQDRTQRVIFDNNLQGDRGRYGSRAGGGPSSRMPGDHTAARRRSLQ